MVVVVVPLLWLRQMMGLLVEVGLLSKLVLFERMLRFFSIPVRMIRSRYWFELYITLCGYCDTQRGYSDTIVDVLHLKPIGGIPMSMPWLATVAKLFEEARIREATSLGKHVCLKKLRDKLKSLEGRVAGRNKDDVEKAISMMKALAIQLTQREGELIQEKEKVKKLATFLKQALEDAKKLVDEERAFASAEIENVRAAIQRVEEAF
ncbi:hypothetical protein J1N35_008187 [Gossypium stocksii]|uniref:Stomatal closure-related actin-binding protein coiled-coil domain-containing protein n=1 Tax=Gossypium stocksii TaxID=47602 RepID=A0A9D4AFW2_9ROSI|nr:hypothetical protein J1N35_008187 [Gossypium stocksii]